MPKPDCKTMERLAQLLRMPVEEPKTYFKELAELVLRDLVLVAGNERFRIREIEFYLNSAIHPDPFVHCDERQLTSGRWYFHSRGGNFRGGTFKGVDITFGGQEEHGGLLIRSIESEARGLINGVCLCAEAMLASTEPDTIAELHALVSTMHVWDPLSPLRLEATARDNSALFSSMRVGLSLKRADEHPKMLKRLASSYRFLNAPKAIKKGRMEFALSLLNQGSTIGEVQAVLGASRAAVARWDQSRKKKIDVQSVVGKSMTRAELCSVVGQSSEA